MQGLWYCTAALMIVFMVVRAPARGPLAGKGDVLIKRITDCDDPGSNEIIIHSNTIRKYNRTAYIYATNMTIPYPLGDNVKVTIAIATYNSGRWRENAYRKEMGGLCTAGKETVPKFFNNFMKQINQTKCPVPPGVYLIRDMDLSLNLVWPYIPYGTFRFDMIFSKNRRIVGCKRFVVKTVPASEKPATSEMQSR